MYLKAVVSRHELEGPPGSRGAIEAPQKRRGADPSYKGKEASHPASGIDRSRVDRQAPLLVGGLGGQSSVGGLGGQSSAAMPEGISPRGKTFARAYAALPLRPSTTMSLVRPVELRPPTDMQVWDLLKLTFHKHMCMIKRNCLGIGD